MKRTENPQDKKDHCGCVHLAAGRQCDYVFVAIGDEALRQLFLMY
jgi:hypothetical protein